MSSKPSKSISTIVGLSSNIIINVLFFLLSVISLKNFDLNKLLITNGVIDVSNVSPTSKGKYVYIVPTSTLCNPSMTISSITNGSSA